MLYLTYWSATMISFHGDINIKEQLIKNLEQHMACDALVQHHAYWSNGKGCAVGCSIVDFGGKPGDHKEYERLFGIPQVLAHLEDGIFEGLAPENSKSWPIDFIKSIPVGKDLSTVWPRFSAWLLVDPEHGVINYAITGEQRDAIKKVVELYKRDNVTKGEWREARNTAAAAAAAAADAASAAAAAAAAAAAYAAAAAAAYAAAAAADSAADADAAVYADAAADSGRKEYVKHQSESLINVLRNT